MSFKNKILLGKHTVGIVLIHDIKIKCQLLTSDEILIMSLSCMIYENFSKYQNKCLGESLFIAQKKVHNFFQYLQEYLI